jgi:hypothetical protein
MIKKWSLVLFCICCTSFFVQAQVSESFTDGDFTNNPTWVGGTTDWIVNAGKQLQSDNAVVNGSFYLSTANTLATGVQWDFYTQLTFATSGANYVDVFLTASASDVTATATSGYFVRIGNTDDEISLYRKDPGGTTFKIIDGLNGTVASSSNNVMKIRVVRNAANVWTLSRDMTGVGTTYTGEGTVTDATYTTSAFFGILVRQSTATFHKRHFFDDISIQPFTPDVTPPAIVSATALTNTTVDILFNEPVEAASAQTLSNYSVNNGIGQPSAAVRDAVNNALVHLTFPAIFPNGTNTITINGVKDLSGNAIVNGTATFSFFTDVTPPTILSATATSGTTVDVLFNEPVEVASAQTLANYSVNNGIGAPATAVRDGANTALVHLTFATTFPNGVTNTITINGVKDIAGNAIVNGTATFGFYTAQQYDVVIDEIMADFSPAVGLPANEWIELKNTSGFSINIQGWRIGDATGLSGPMPAYVLKPDSFVVVCSATSLPAMLAFGPAISVTGFPSLNDDGDQLLLTNTGGKTIHSVSYTSDWYQNELKKAGGWTLEMIDTKNPCSGFTNWKASTDAKGGTPAKKNSIDAVNKDVVAPRLLRAYATGSQDIVLVFDEPLDSTKAATIGNYSISDGIGAPQSAVAVAPNFNHVNLHLSAPLQANKVYTVTVSNVTDCGGNLIGSARTAKVGITGFAVDQDLVINEVLFNPKSSGVDFVEIYNRSNKIIDLKNTYIANRNTAGAVSSITQLSVESYLLFPEEFMVITSDPAIIKRDYITLNPDAFVKPASMPSFNDDKGNVIILNEQGNIVDELAYSEKWHFALIDNNEGISLERIDYNVKSKGGDSTRSNWHSAATSVGYATPTYKNSQYRADLQVQGTIVVTPEIMSPDNDGMDDFATITYNFPSPGYVANITIFDAAGRLVRNLQRNALCGITGNFRWDGLGEKNQALSVGIYVIYTEVFNLQGKKKRFKNTIVLARRQ